MKGHKGHPEIDFSYSVMVKPWKFMLLSMVKPRVINDMAKTKHVHPCWNPRHACRSAGLYVLEQFWLLQLPQALILSIWVCSLYSAVKQFHRTLSNYIALLNGRHFDSIWRRVYVCWEVMAGKERRYEAVGVSTLCWTDQEDCQEFCKTLVMV